MGARRKFSRGGQSHRHFKKSTRFRRAEGANDKFCVFSRRFGLKYRVSSASAEGASENFRVFCRTAAYDVTFSNSRAGGGGKCPHLAPPAGAHGRTYHQCSVDALFLEEHNEHVVPGQQPRGEVNSGFYIGLYPMQQVFLTLFATICSYNSIVCTTLVQYACGPVVLKSIPFNLFKDPWYN